ncbi:MAG: carboxypeptidase regulatory-like domain-containing protein [Candidatus Acidiferrales bacterium]
MTKTLVRMWGAAAVVLLLAVIAAAQGTGRIDGQVLDTQGNPLPGATITFKSPDSGQTLTSKTDKNGKYSILGLRTGIYNITLADEKGMLNYQDQIHVEEQGDNHKSWNFKDLVAAGKAANPDEEKKRDEEQKKFEGLKSHFTTGVASMNDAKAVKTQLQASPTDQALKDKLAADYQAAIVEFKLAEQAAGAKDIANHSLVWANMGAADEGLGQWADAADAFDHANQLKPAASYYVAEATDMAKSGKGADAPGMCEKAIAVDPTVASMCWKNLGIVLNNAGDLKGAVVPLQKATQADPKDAQGWYLLGGALASMMDAKQVGDKMVYTPAPGTVEAYQKCIDVAPAGPYAAQCKETLDGIQQLIGGVDTTVGKRAKKKSS